MKDFNSSRNKSIIVLDCWSKNIEEYFHLRNTDNINISDKYTTQDVTNVMNIILKHANSMKQGMIGLQGKFIESENERLKQSICIYQLTRENISAQNLSTNFFRF